MTLSPSQCCFRVAFVLPHASLCSFTLAWSETRSRSRASKLRITLILGALLITEQRSTGQVGVEKTLRNFVRIKSWWLGIATLITTTRVSISHKNHLPFFPSARPRIQTVPCSYGTEGTGSPAVSIRRCPGRCDNCWWQASPSSPSPSTHRSNPTTRIGTCDGQVPNN